MLFSIGLITGVFLISIMPFPSKSIKIFTIAFFLFFISICRSFYFTTDAIYYVEKYELLRYKSLNSFWTELISDNGKDPFFYFSSKIISDLGFSARAWLALISFFFLLAISYLIHSYSKKVFFSFFIFITLGYFYFSLTGLRQTIAISIFILAILKILDRKNIQAIFLIVLASMFHSSALVTLLIFIIKNIKNKIIIFSFLSSSFIFSLFYGDKIKSLLQNTIDNISVQDSIYRSTTLSYTGFLIQLSIYLFCLILLNKKKNIDNKINILLNISLLGVMFSMFSPVVAEFFRISLYFNMINIVLIPIAIQEITNQKLKYLLTLIIMIFLFIYFVDSAEFFDYQFYWEVGR